jgi:hypothetical protein
MTEAEKFLIKRGINIAEMDGHQWFRQTTAERMASVAVDEFAVRDEYIETFSFAVPTESILQEICKYSPLLEIGAGSGYWAYELAKRGADIVATDTKKGRYSPLQGHWSKKYTSVETLHAVKAVRKYPNRTLLSIWPDYDKPWSGEALKEFKGEVVIYIGESSGGCTGDNLFHRILEKDYKELESMMIPQFGGAHDYLNIYQRKETK